MICNGSNKDKENCQVEKMGCEGCAHNRVETKEAIDALYVLLHCALKDTEYTTQKEQFNIVYKYINDIEEDKLTNI